ncbi:MAG: transposase [Acidobacteria bacterium]|nr:transposase [Acidobacteriota bacterium]
MFTGRPTRLKTFDYRGYHRYFLTFCTHERRHLFVLADCVAVVHLQFLRAAAESDMSVLAYCFMPDHVHLLIEGLADDADGRLFIARAKQLSGFHFKRQFGVPLWQPFGFERTLRSDESAFGVARYILENPIRAGLVTDVRDYPFLGSNVYTVDEILEAIQMDACWHART